MDYSYIIIPAIVVLTSQMLKLATDGIKGNFDLKNVFLSYGGMPSAHTAFAISITTLIGLRQGFDNPLFALGLIFTLIVMRDAVTFRNILGQQARAFNMIVTTIVGPAKHHLPRLREQMGHTISEVAAGALWGITLTYFLSLL